MPVSSYLIKSFNFFICRHQKRQKKRAAEGANSNVFSMFEQRCLNVKQEEIDDMLKEAPGPINFTVFLTMFGEKLKGADPEETILNAFKVFDPERKYVLRKE
ncbi:hypothetical protein QTP70_020313 [Hemibagrus guttatus]|uniref:Myosin light chain 2 n=1 Tax=Hemibagrus guttatus TaxID=175788 RepID=A0AAE0PWE5_9TELE|nr:hypothetical protein QTP70_020313 [Hemibagrus guttatus]